MKLLHNIKLFIGISYSKEEQIYLYSLEVGTSSTGKPLIEYISLLRIDAFLIRTYPGLRSLIYINSRSPSIFNKILIYLRKADIS